VIAQRSLNLSISQRTVLLPVESLRVHLGVDADTILARIDGGDYRWVFDVSSVKQRRLNSAKHVRELRLWAREIVAPEVTRDLSPKAAVAEILGARERFYGTEIAQLLLVSRPQIFRLHESKELSGDIVGGKLWVQRAALETFLHKRLVNADLAVAHA
jgi:hypothetical protein